MEEHPTTTWQAMQDANVFYKRQQVYSIPGKLPHLDDFHVAGCRYGGPIGRHTNNVAVCVIIFMSYLALMRDTTRVIALAAGAAPFAKAQIQVYSPAGEGLLLFNVAISPP